MSSFYIGKIKLAVEVENFYIEEKLVWNLINCKVYFIHLIFINISVILQKDLKCPSIACEKCLDPSTVLTPLYQSINKEWHNYLPQAGLHTKRPV